MIVLQRSQRTGNNLSLWATYCLIYGICSQYFLISCLRKSLLQQMQIAPKFPHSHSWSCSSLLWAQKGSIAQHHFYFSIFTLCKYLGSSHVCISVLWLNLWQSQCPIWEQGDSIFPSVWKDEGFPPWLQCHARYHQYRLYCFLWGWCLSTLSSSPCSQSRLLFLTVVLLWFREFLWCTSIAMCRWRVRGQILVNSPNSKMVFVWHLWSILSRSHL